MKYCLMMCIILLIGCQKVTKFDIEKAENTCRGIRNITFLYKDGSTVLVKCDDKENTVIAK